MKRSLYNFRFLSFLLFVSVAAYSDPLIKERPQDAAVGTVAPLWELGFGAGLITYPDYHGSKHYNLLPIPIPSLVYRGSFIKSDNEGLKSLLLDSNRVHVDFSVGAGPPTSKKNTERKDMEPLDPALEMGFVCRFLLADFGNHRLDIEGTNRWAVTFSPKFADTPTTRGRVFEVPLLYTYSSGPYDDYKKLVFFVGKTFGNRAYHSYYYGVQEKDATEDRPAYYPDGGDAGWFSLILLRRRVGTYSTSGYFKYENIKNAVFNDSPLVRTNNYISAGIMFVYYFTKSEESVAYRP